jgi:hypothetical protein
MIAIVGPFYKIYQLKGSTEADGEVIEAEDQPRENEQ